jgi:8-oxo-dGTP diphosphatase
MGAPTAIATAVLVRDGLVLMAHRHAMRQAYPDCWSLVGGHLEPGESPREAVIRECLEELGVRIDNPLRIPMTVNDTGIDMHAFLVTSWAGEPVNTAPGEHDDLRWFGPSDLKALTMAHPESLSSIAYAVQAATTQR